MKDFRRILVSIAIAILLTLFLVFAVDLFYTEPKYEEYCNFSLSSPYPYKEIPTNTVNCTTFKYDYNQCYNGRGYTNYEYDSNGCPYNVTCSDCNIKYEESKKEYAGIAFTIFIILAVLALIAGISFLVEPVSFGFLLGGLIIILQATIRYFSDFGKVTKVIVLGIELAVLIWISYKKFK